MSEQVLSQDEVSALLETVEETNEPAEGEVTNPVDPPSESKPDYSLANKRTLFPRVKQQNLTPELEASLTAVHESFSYNSASILSVALRAQTLFKLENMEQMGYDDFLRGLPEPSSLWALRVGSGEGHFLLCLEPSLVHIMVDFLMGGEGSLPKDRNSITELDQSVIESAIESMCEELKKAWGRVLEFDLTIDSHETRPGLLHFYSPSELVVCVKMVMTVAMNEGSVFLGVPGRLLTELTARLEHQVRTRTEEAEEAAQQITQIVRDLPTSLEAGLKSTIVSVSELLNVKEGDVVKLDHRIEDPVSVSVNGQAKFLANVVVSNNERVIEIV